MLCRASDQESMRSRFHVWTHTPIAVCIPLGYLRYLCQSGSQPILKQSEVRLTQYWGASICDHVGQHPADWMKELWQRNNTSAFPQWYTFSFQLPTVYTNRRALQAHTDTEHRKHTNRTYTGCMLYIPGCTSDSRTWLSPLFLGLMERKGLLFWST